MLGGFCEACILIIYIEEEEAFCFCFHKTATNKCRIVRVEQEKKNRQISFKKRRRGCHSLVFTGPPIVFNTDYRAPGKTSIEKANKVLEFHALKQRRE